MNIKSTHLLLIVSFIIPLKSMDLNILEPSKIENPEIHTLKEKISDYNALTFQSLFQEKAPYLSPAHIKELEEIAEQYHQDIKSYKFHSIIMGSAGLLVTLKGLYDLFYEMEFSQDAPDFAHYEKLNNSQIMKNSIHTTCSCAIIIFNALLYKSLPAKETNIQTIKSVIEQEKKKRMPIETTFKTKSFIQYCQELTRWGKSIKDKK